MKALIFTDFHLDLYRSFFTIRPDGLNSRFYDQLQVAGQINAIKREEEVTHLFFLGDWINSQAESMSKTLYTYAHAIGAGLSRDVQSYWIVGNHDIYRDLNILSTFSSFPNATVVSTTTQVEIDGLKIDLVPWNQPFPGKKFRGDVLMGHLPVMGSFMGTNFTAPAEEGIPPSELVGYKYIFMGHFHTAQRIKVKGAKEAMYIGSVMQYSFNEDVENKAVYLFDGTEVRSKVVESPKIYKVEISSQEGLQYFLDHYNERDYYQLVIKATGIVIPEFDHRIMIEYDIETSHESRMGEVEGEDLIQTVTRFVDQTNTQIDKEKAKRILEEML